MIEINEVNKYKRRLANFIATNAEGCWIFNGNKLKAGYGTIKVKGRHQLAHRLSYYLYKEAIPEGLFILHMCRNKDCCNPDHLYAGTHQQNMIDKIRDSTNVSSYTLGEFNPNAKLNESKVKAIRKLQDSMTVVELSIKYKVNIESIRSVIKRKTWAHID